MLVIGHYFCMDSLRLSLLHSGLDLARLSVTSGSSPGWALDVVSLPVRRSGSFAQCHFGRESRMDAGRSDPARALLMGDSQDCLLSMLLLFPPPPHAMIQGPRIG